MSKIEGGLPLTNSCVGSASLVPYLEFALALQLLPNHMGGPPMTKVVGQAWRPAALLREALAARRTNLRPGVEAVFYSTHWAARSPFPLVVLGRATEAHPRSAFRRPV